MQWSVAEQTVPATAFAGDEHPHLTSISLRTDPNRSHLVVMELHVEPGSEIAGYALLFNRNGELIGSEQIKAPPPPEGGGMHSASQHASAGKKK
jgi:hypothetical protein